jgi:glycosyltransferase involved in cell wall biosynthesis
MVVHGPYPVGEPRVAREVGAALQVGFDVDVVALRRKGEPATEVVDGARVFRLPLAHRRGVGLVGAMAEYLGFAALASLRVAGRSLRSRYAIVQVHAPPDFLIASAVIPKLLGTRVVLDVHDLSSHMFSMRFGRRGLGHAAEAALLAVERLAARVADAVVTVHEPYRQELCAHGVPAEKITVVMNTLDESLLPAEHAKPSTEGFRIVYHGTVTPPYGVEVVVDSLGEVVRRVPGARVEIYGEGDSLPAIRRRAADAGLESRVVTSDGYLPHREVLERVAGASVGVIPNLPSRLNQFALSSKLFEYVALGIPVVASDLPTLRAHFGDEEVLYFGPGDAAALQEALLAVALDPSAAAGRAEAARRRYAAYRWPVQAAGYGELLRRLAPAVA